MISVGDTLPGHTFMLRERGESSQPTTEDLFANKKVVMFAVPGAFTPTCSQAHLPGFVVNADDIKAKGVDSIICISVNDAFVMEAWGNASNAENLTMLADGDGEFSDAIGLAKQTGKFGGIRSLRYAMIVDNKVVTHLAVEEAGQFEVSSAEAILAAL
ncbi:peroxiredoxin [Planctobacterium marinum]|uniref:peroxiredoxin n=1 Tax=Planctobacterium marinum TaxID=1631968 RepID=UPI001E5A37A0|nr:peroxiredoxin [Planctobacterium marinum]MCC2607759.1 peroxiredoxin [Planctobacterium marinum]